MKKNYQKLFVTTTVLCMGAILLSACSGNTKRALGLNKEAPDEFTVVAKAPLVLPPDYNLVPPAQMAQTKTAEDIRPQSRPQDILFTEVKRQPEAQKKNTDYDENTRRFLAMAGAEGENSNIRRTINKETGDLIEENRDVVDKIMFWLEDDVNDPTAVTVDAAEEKKRLQNNARTGKSVTDGQTPSVQPQKRKIFD